MKKSYTVLYIDDDHDDLQLIAEAFLTYTEELKVVHAHNGREGIEALEQMHKERKMPCLVIMDINMPVLNGKDALVKIKSMEKFRHLPIVLFSTSNNRNDKSFAEKWGASYITKPSNYNDLEGLVKNFVSLCLFEAEKRA